MEYKLLIHPILKPERFFGFKIKKVIQNRSFRWGVRIKNIGSKQFKGCMIHDVRLRPAEMDDYWHEPAISSFSVIPLKPDQSIKIWFHISTFEVDGPAWIELTLKSKQSGEEIKTYQLDKNSSKPAAIDKNYWKDTIFITNETSIHQRMTNYLLIFLSILIISISIISLIL